MLKMLIACGRVAWHDEMKMLGLSIWILTVPALLIVLNFGLFFVAMSRHAAPLIGLASIGSFCMARAVILRLKKLI